MWRKRLVKYLNREVDAEELNSEGNNQQLSMQVSNPATPTLPCPMAKRHKIKARNLRRLLIDVLGGKCAVPGCKDENLTFDVIKAKGHKHHKGSTDQRMAFYFKELAKHNLQLLCDKHNSDKGDMDNDEYMTQFKNPF